MAIRFDFTGDNSNFLNAVKGVQGGIRDTIAMAEQGGQSIDDMFSQAMSTVGKFAGIGLGLGTIKEFASKVVEVRSYFQDIESSMEVFLGSAEKAADFTQKLKDYAYYNMFEFSDLAAASKQMIAYGHDVDSIIGRLDQLSNIATGTKADLMEMVSLYNRAKNLGKIDSQGLQSWAVRGVVVTDVLKEMGEEINGTSVSFEQLNKVLDKVTGEGGMFHGLMENQMSNISAEIGQLQDNMAAMFNEIGENTQGIITGSIKAASALVDHYKEIGEALAVLIGTYGTYKAALMAVNTYQVTAKNIGFDAEIDALNSILPAKEQNANADLKMAAANGTLTQQKAALIAEMRKEAALHVESLQAKAKEAVIDYEAAFKAAEAASLRKEQADLVVASAQKAVDSAYNMGDAIAQELAEEQLSIAVADQYAAAKTLEATRTDMAAAASKRNVAAKKADAAATALDTAASTADVTATGLLTQAKLALNKAILAVNKSFLASPWFWIAAAVVGLTAGIYKLITAESALEKAERKAGEAMSEANKALDERKQKVNSLLSTIQDENATNMQRLEAYEELQKIMPSITDNYSMEEIASMGAAKAAKTLAAAMDDERITSAKQRVEEATKRVQDLEKLFEQAGQGTNRWILSRDLSEAKAELEMFNQQYQDLIELNERSANVGEETSKTFEEAYKEAEDAYNKALNKLKEIRENRSLYTQEDWENAKNELDSAENKYKNLGGDTSSKKSGKTAQQIAKEQQEYKDLIEKQGRERAEAYTDMIFSTRQAEIDAMDDGTDKTLKQIELDFEKEKEQIARGYENLKQQKIDKAKELWDANPANNDKPFDASLVDTSYTPEEIANKEAQEAAALKKRNDSLKDMREKEIADMNDYLIKYGDYFEKRNAIMAKANQEKEGKNEWERKAIDKETEQTLSDLEVEYKKRTSAVTALFDDMKDKSVKDLREIEARGREALEFLKSGDWDALTGIRLGISKAEFDMISQSPAELEKVAQGVKEVGEEADAAEPALKKISIGLKSLFAASDAKSTREALDMINEGLSEGLQIAGFLSDTLSQLGDSLGSGVLSGAADALNAGMDAVNQAMSGAQAGAAFGPWGAAAGAAIGLVGSLSSSLSRLHDAKHERKIQQIAEQIETLDKSYQKLGDSVEQAFSKDASNLIDQQNKLLAQQKVLIQQQINEEEKKKKTDQSRINEYKQQIADIDKLISDNEMKAVDAIFGEDVKSAINDFASAYASAWANNESRTESAKEAVKKMMQNMVTESIKAAIQSSSKMEEIRDKLKEFYNDNVLTGWEQDYIYKMASELQNQLDNQFGWADSLMGGSSSYSQQASSRGFQTMSQDTAEELNGRFTALQESGRNTEVSVALILSNMGQMMALATSGNTTLLEIRNLHMIGNGYLEDIRKYTKPITELGEKLDRIIDNTK